MKRLLLCLTLIAAAAVFSTSASAATATYSGTASYGQPYTIAFTTQTVGDLSVLANWAPKKGTRYVLDVKHLTNPSDTLSYDMLCSTYQNLSGNPQVDLVGPGITGDATLGAYSCSFANAPAGYWTVSFRPISGKASVTLSITTP